jgi:hypothetical protein
MYTVKMLTDVEFDRLPYKHVKEALGCANTKTKTAYVRRTGIRPLDSHVTEHELDELIAKTSPHEVDGIRYKMGGQTIRNVASIAAAFIPGVGPFLSAGMQLGHGLYEQSKGRQTALQTGIGTVGSLAGGLMGQASKGYQAGVAGSKAAGGGILGQSLSGAKGMLGFGAGAAGSGTAASAAPAASAAGSTGFNIVGKVPAGAIQPSSALNWAGMGSGTYPGLAATMGAAGLGFGAGQTGQAASATAPQTTGASTAASGGINATKEAVKPSLLQQIMKSPMTQTAMGAAVPLIGNAFAPQTQKFDPAQSQLFNDVLGRVKSGTMTPLSDEQRTAITAQYDDELSKAKESLLSYWKGVRPGSDITNDTELQQQMRELETEYGRNKSNAVVQAQLNLTQGQTQMLSELAALDVYSLAQQAQISYEEASAFKNMLAEMGMAVSGGSFAGTGGTTNTSGGGW